MHQYFLIRLPNKEDMKYCLKFECEEFNPSPTVRDSDIWALRAKQTRDKQLAKHMYQGPYTTRYMK